MCKSMHALHNFGLPGYNTRVDLELTKQTFFEAEKGTEHMKCSQE